MVPGLAPVTVKGLPPKNFHSYESTSPVERLLKVVLPPSQIFVEAAEKLVIGGSPSLLKQKLVVSWVPKSPPEASILSFSSLSVYEPFPLVQQIPSPIKSIITKS